MPYAQTSELPEGVRNALPAHAQRIFMEAFNSAHEKYPDDEARCMSIAWGAVKNAGYEKGEDGKWVKSGASFDVIEREAKLFEAGDYTDTHGIEITEADLDAMVANFEECPIKIQHEDTPFDGALGFLRSLWRKGKELFGKLVFSPEAWALAEKAGVRKLSVAITPEKDKIREVSLVSDPRVASARVFAGGPIVEFDAGEIQDFLPRETIIERFAALLGGMSTKTEVIQMTEQVKKADDTGDLVVSTEMLDALRTDHEKDQKRIAALEFALRERDAKATLATFSGKLTPEAAPYAEAILLHGVGEVEVGGEKMTLAEAFGKFAFFQPAIPEGEPKAKLTVEFSEADEDILAKLGVSKEAAQKYAAV